MLICPALKAQVDLSPKDKLQVGIGRIVDEHRTIPVPLEPELFTRNPKYVDFIRNDPLGLREVTARFFFETAIWDRWLLRTYVRHSLRALHSAPGRSFRVLA